MLGAQRLPAIQGENAPMTMIARSMNAPKAPSGLFRVNRSAVLGTRTQTGRSVLNSRSNGPATDAVGLPLQFS